MTLLAELPSATSWTGSVAITSDVGPVISNGVVWVPFATFRPASYADDHTLIAADLAGVIMTKATPTVLTIPPVSTLDLSPGVVILIEQHGEGTVSLAKGAPEVNIRSRGGLVSLAGQYAVATLRNRGADEWILCGDLA